MDLPAAIRCFADPLEGVVRDLRQTDFHLSGDGKYERLMGLLGPLRDSMAAQEYRATFSPDCTAQHVSTRTGLPQQNKVLVLALFFVNVA